MGGGKPEQGDQRPRDAGTTVAALRRLAEDQKNARSLGNEGGERPISGPAVAGASPGPRARRFVSLTSLDWGGDSDAADALYKRVLWASLAVFCVLVVLLVTIKPPPVERQKEERIPERLTKLFEEQQVKPKLEKPKPPEPLKPKEPLPKADLPSEAPAKTEAAPEAKPVAKAEPKAPPGADLAKPSKPTGEEIAAARERASQTGLVAMRDQLAALRNLSSTDSLRAEQSQVGTAGTQRQAERDLIGKAATSGSGGVSTKAIAHGGGGSLEGRSTSKVSGPAGGGPSLAEVERESKGRKRTDEEIKLAFDANKSAIYGIYRRALRDNPLLEGRVVLKISIDPSGAVTSCTIASSALKDPELEAKLVARIMLINFGTRPKLEPWSGTYHIDFVPSA